jgi:diguanylate cyclase (GGDEF)-like protein/PAS domain S-box-containing protein
MRHARLPRFGKRRQAPPQAGQNLASEAAAATTLPQADLVELLNNLPIAAYRSEPQPPWRLHFIGKSAESITGHSAQAFESGAVTWAQIVHPDDLSLLATKVADACAQGRSFEAEYRVLDASGRIRWVQAKGEEKALAAGSSTLVGFVRDVTETRSVRLELQSCESTHRKLSSATVDLISLMELDGQLVYVNSALQQHMSVEDPSVLVGTNWLAYFPDEDHEIARMALKAAAVGEVFKFVVQTKDAARRWLDFVVTPVPGDDGSPTQVLAVARDITERMQADEAALRAANHDALTQLYNRAYFTEALEKSVASEQPFAIVLFDLDDFKQINDTAGHDAGDALLQEFAHRLSQGGAPETIVARLGGDEFAVLMPSVATPGEVLGRVEDVLLALRVPVPYDEQLLDCAASAGISIFPLHGTSRAELMKSADIALYAAKAAGRDCVCVFEGAMREEVQRRASMLSIARTAIAEQAIEPYFQPKVDLQTGRIAGFEALLRWHHPRRGVQLPMHLAAAFDDPQLAVLISEQMLKRVIRQIQVWGDEGYEFGHVALNVGAAEFTRNNLAERLLHELQTSGIPHRYIQVEVTEGVFLGPGSESVERALRALSDGGVTIALDDFGTGYASLTHLKKYPVDVIKIDRSFVRDITSSIDDHAVVSALTQLGSVMRMEVVAEGVETLEQARQLRKIGCNYGQGFAFSPAVPGDAVQRSRQRFEL